MRLYFYGKTTEGYKLEPQFSSSILFFRILVKRMKDNEMEPKGYDG